MTATAIFPGWHTPSNLKWCTAPLSNLPGMERFHRAYKSPLESLVVIVAWEAGRGWHLSISHPTRYPSWEEIRDARYDLLPDACTMGMLLPAKAEYINLHPNCFHLYQVPDDLGDPV